MAADFLRHSLYKTAMHTSTHTSPATCLPLQGVRVLSLALNLPGPGALLRCHQMGAQCTKLEPLAAADQASADPMLHYSPQAYAQLHAGIELLQANLKSPEGQALLHARLAQTDVLLTSFRPSALSKLGLDWGHLQTLHPRLNMVRIFGSTAPGEADHAGHDLTYQAEAGLVDHGHLPASLFADMNGAVMASEAVLQTLLARAQTGQGHCVDIGLAQAAQWLAWPRTWRMTTPDGDVGGAHAGYRMYRCQNAWVALAALEPHFAQRICEAAGLHDISGSVREMRDPAVHAAIEAFMLCHTSAQIAALAAQQDIPLHLVMGGQP